MDVRNAFAVVYAADGSWHKVCWNSREVRAAEEELAAAGAESAVFYRDRTPQVVNNHSGNSSGNVFQAGVIHNGVWS